MKISKQELYGLTSRYVSGEAKPEEIRLLEKAYMNAALSLGFSVAQEDQAEDVDQIGKETWEALVSRINKEERRYKNQVRANWLRTSFTVAAAVAAIAFGIWLFRGVNSQDNGLHPELHDIGPGKNTATLTLSDGRTISLSEAKTGVLIGKRLKYNDNTEVIPGQAPSGKETGTGRIVLKTPRGATYQVTLSDGTKVWLNAASSLSYTAELKGRDRRVELEGEAYFEVAKDKVHPFIVKSRGQEVKVLGTHFNINSYADEPFTKTTLLEGSVKVNQVLLKPNQQALLNGGVIKVQQANLDEEMAWKNGDFLFDGEDFRAAMRKVARWYDVEVVYDPLVPQRIKLGGWVSRSKNLSAVLKVLESTGEVHFKVEERRIMVKK